MNSSIFLKYFKIFGLNKAFLLFVFLLNLIGMFLAFLSVTLILPFADYIFNQSTKSFSPFTLKIIEYLNLLQIEPNTKIMGILFFLSIILYFLYEIAYVYIITKKKNSFLQIGSSYIIDKIFKSNLNFFLKNESAKLINFMREEMNKITDMLSFIFLFFNQIVLIFIFIALPLVINAKLTLTFIVILFICISPFFILRKFAASYGKQSISDSGEYLGKLKEFFFYFKNVISHSTQKNVGTQIRFSLEKFLNTRLILELINKTSAKILQPVGITSLVITVIIYTPKTSDLTNIIVVFWSLSRILGPAGQLFANYIKIKSYLPALKLYSDLDKSTEQFRLNHQGKIIEKFNEVSFKKIKFSYNNDKYILNDCDFNIKRSEKVLIIGESGCGKSTFVDLLLNLIEPNSGEIKLNNISYSKINFEKFRNKISYVPQEISLVNFSTIDYFNFINSSKIDKEKIEFFLKKFGIYSTVLNLKNKLDNKLGDKGILLSGGQKQRIILAAALSRKPEILILDEATNALDPQAEQEIFDILLEDNNLTVIAISHQTNNTDKFDLVYRFKDKKFISS